MKACMLWAHFISISALRENGEAMKVQLGEGAVYSTTWCFNLVTFSVGTAGAVYISQATNTI